MKKIALATGNRDKAREIQNILKGFILILRDEFPGAPDVEETGKTLEENAILKAEAIAGHTGLPALADDSGLEVEALGGLPGVRSARFAGEDASYGDNNARLLKLLKGEENRKARFRCVIAVSFPGGKNLTREGFCRGRITRAPRGSGGFGYDPVFLVEGLGQTFAELSPCEKNSISHRAKALREIKKALDNEPFKSVSPGADE